MSFYFSNWTFFCKKYNLIWDSSFWRMNYKDTKPYMSAFLKINLFTDFAALCLTDFIDWRYTHSVVCIFDPPCELLPPWTKELYMCTVAPMVPSLWPPPPSSPSQCTVYADSVWLWGGGDVELCCRPYSAGVLHSVSDQIQTCKIATPPQTKKTSLDDIKGTVAWDGFLS